MEAIFLFILCFVVGHLLKLTASDRAGVAFVSMNRGRFFSVLFWAIIFTSQLSSHEVYSTLDVLLNEPPPSNERFVFLFALSAQYSHRSSMLITYKPCTASTHSGSPSVVPVE